MKYEGKLYGKVNGKYFDTGHTTEQWDEMIDALMDAKKAIESLSKEDLGKAHNNKYEWYVRDELLDKVNNALIKTEVSLEET